MLAKGKNKKIAKILSQITKIEKEYSDKQIAVILEDVKKELDELR